MSHAHGTYLGSVRDIEGIRARSVIDADSGCWHFRTANGRPMPRGRRHVVWVFGRGCISLLRAVWEFKTGRQMGQGQCAFRVCQSYDCANPAHVRWGTRADLGRAVSKRGVLKNDPERARRARLASAKQSKLTPELRLWAIESGQSSYRVAVALGVATETICKVRKRWRDRDLGAASNVFAVASVGAGDHRRAA